MISVIIGTVLFTRTALIAETLHSKIDYNNTRPSTRAPWPRFTLDHDSDEGAQQFVLHRPTSTGPATSPPHTENDSKFINKTYVRYSLPNQSSDSNENKPSKAIRKRLYQDKTKSFQRVNPNDIVKVSLPKIYVDMAFTGHYSRISVPRKRIRWGKTKKISSCIGVKMVPCDWSDQVVFMS